MIVRIGEQLLPLLDRLNRLLLHNLRALREPRNKAAVGVSIGAAAQVNVAGQQVAAQQVRGADTE